MNKVKLIILLLAVPFAGISQNKIQEVTKDDSKVIIVGDVKSINQISVDSLIQSSTRDYYFKDTKTTKYLNLGFAPGIGTVKNSIAPNFNAYLGVGGFNGAVKNITAFYSGYYSFGRNDEGNSYTDINSFLNVEVGFSGISVGAGMLVSRQGDHFDKNTFKLFGSHSWKFLTVTPELYIVGGFKKVYPGITVSVPIFFPKH